MFLSLCLVFVFFFFLLFAALNSSFINSIQCTAFITLSIEAESTMYYIVCSHQRNEQLPNWSLYIKWTQRTLSNMIRWTILLHIIFLFNITHAIWVDFDLYFSVSHGDLWNWMHSQQWRSQIGLYIIRAN